MFEEFKQKHGGLGPAQLLFDNATHGYLSSRIAAKAVGQQMEDTLEAVRGDDSLSPELKDNARQLLAHGVYDLGTAIKNVEGVRAEANTQRTITGAFAPVLAGAKDLFDNAKSEEDRGILSQLMAQGEAARQLALDPSTRQEGQNMLGQVADKVNAFTAQNKANKVAADVKAQEMARDLDNTQFSRFTNIREDWQKQSAPAVQIQNAFRSVQDLAAQKATPQTDAYLARLAGTIFNPGVAVRPGEDPGDQYFNALNSAGEGIGAAVKYVMTGGAGFTDHERDTLLYALTQRARQENAAQVERNTAALNAGKAAGLPSKYLDQLTMAPMDLGELGASVDPSNTELKPKATGSSSSSSSPAPSSSDDGNEPEALPSDPGFPTPIPGLTVPTRPGFEDVPGLTQMDRLRRLWSPELRRQKGETLDAYSARIAARHAPTREAQLANTDEYQTAGDF